MRHDVPHPLMPISPNQKESATDATPAAVDLAETVVDTAVANARGRIVRFDIQLRR
jgi:hypothetical protein